MNHTALEVIAVKEDPIVLDYAKSEKPKRKWYNPLKYKGAVVGLGYSLIWPATVLAYISGCKDLYDKYLPHESFQDNAVYYLFKTPSEFVADSIENLVRDTNMNNRFVVLGVYLGSWALTSHIIEKTVSFTKKKILKRK
ncbi:hypothetical protein HYV88_00870 [Candidatus Woesearchaeota archaeon]|nr:hypothetical protein [Candidatus Woesearchaeota archaeon]